MSFMRDAPPRSRRAAIAGLAAIAACSIGAAIDHASFFQAWLVSWLFFFGLSLAAAAQLCIHDLTGGEWGLVLRPTLEAVAAALPMAALFALPLAFACRISLRAKAWYLNAPSFLASNVTVTR